MGYSGGRVLSRLCLLKVLTYCVLLVDIRGEDGVPDHLTVVYCTAKCYMLYRVTLIYGQDLLHFSVFLHGPTRKTKINLACKTIGEIFMRAEQPERKGGHEQGVFAYHWSSFTCRAILRGSR